MKSDAAWEEYGRVDPYFGVLNHAQFRGGLTREQHRDFFASGEEHVALVLNTIREHLDAGFQPRSAVDFGCGVGRLLVPLARRCPRVVGVDVSESMLQEARRNCEAQGLAHVEFVKSDDALSRLRGEFDLIHSVIVFQHIPPERGEALLQRLIDRLAEGGVGALHFTYARRASAGRKAVHWMRSRVPLVNGVVNLLQGRRFSYPMMQMNNYSLSRIFHRLQANGCNHSYVRFTDHGGHLGVILFFQKKALPVL